MMKIDFEKKKMMKIDFESKSSFNKQKSVMITK